MPRACGLSPPWVGKTAPSRLTAGPARRARAPARPFSCPAAGWAGVSSRTFHKLPTDVSSPRPSFGSALAAAAAAQNLVGGPRASPGDRAVGPGAHSGSVALSSEKPPPGAHGLPASAPGSPGAARDLVSCAHPHPPLPLGFSPARGPLRGIRGAGGSGAQVRAAEDRGRAPWGLSSGIQESRASPAAPRVWG